MPPRAMAVRLNPVEPPFKGPDDPVLANGVKTPFPSMKKIRDHQYL